jgi:hypothetical protein
MSQPIENILDREFERWDWNSKAARERRARSRRAFEGHRKRVDANSHPLRRKRAWFRSEGLTVQMLSQRSTVAESVIRGLEHGDAGSDASWTRLALALDCRRCEIDPSWHLGS